MSTTISETTGEQSPWADELPEPVDDVPFSPQTITRLRALQHVICLEEGRDVSLDDVLNRVLDFYRQFVPYD